MPLKVLPEFWFLLDSFWADFMIAFVLFMSLSYAVLADRLHHNRSAVVASSSLSLTLASGLVWWESVNHFRLLHLGPIALGFLVLIIATVIFGVFRQISGSMPAAFLSLGSCLLFGWSVELNWLIDPEIVSLITWIMVIAGMSMVLSHKKELKLTGKSSLETMNDNLESENQATKLGHRIQEEISSVQKDSKYISNNPDTAKRIQIQIEKILPQAGILTVKMAELRRKANLIKNGHAVKLKQLRNILQRTPADKRASIVSQMRKVYKQFNFDQRIERLDNVVAETEKRIRQTLNRSIQKLSQKDTAGLNKLLNHAKRLQKHNIKLLSTIQRSEKKLLSHSIKIIKQGDKQ